MSDTHKPMTQKEIAAIQGRLKAITQPTWTNQFGVVIAREKNIAVALYSRGVTREDQAANAEFIAAAPTDIARLLAEVERLREENKRLCGELERVHEEADWLAESLEIESPYCYECEFKDERYSEYEENITWCAHAPDGTNDTCDQSWREAARKAVEEKERYG
jgi:predicted Zn-ribbon and HTH transcriptional regulator